MPLKFRFDFKKAIQLVNIFSRKCPGVGRLKALKLVFFADLENLKNHGRLITGDKYVAMKMGPVPSATYNLMKSDISDSREDVYRNKYLDVSNPYYIKPLTSPNIDVFSRSDLATIKQIIEQYGTLDANELVKKTHNIKEWERAWYSDEDRGSVEMELENFFQDKDSDTYKKALMKSDIADIF